VAGGGSALVPSERKLNRESESPAPESEQAFGNIVPNYDQIVLVDLHSPGIA
jgi:hypothetical protein